MFERELRDLAFVPRWVILRTIRTQSVAEHSFFVAVYAEQIANLISWGGDRVELLHAALWHDAEESFTGDIPGPSKRSMVASAGKKWIIDALEERFPGEVRPITDETRRILKVANLLDEVLYLAGEIQMGNLAAKHMYNLSMSRLYAAWRELPISVLMAEKMWPFVEAACEMERSMCSRHPENNSDLAPH